jgi:methionine-rich copper-binding protein CopC
MKRHLSALIFAAAFAAAAPALAHTEVRETSIAENAALSAAPENFTVAFSAHTGLAVVSLTDAAGRAVDLNYTPPRQHASSFTIPLPRLAPGNYTLTWRTIAHDGHAMTGAVHFSITG